MMDAEKWKDTILAKSREYVEIGVSVASDLTEKGKTQAKILSNQAKISKAQRQLGALVYSLHKAGEENQPLVDKYIEAIAEIEKNIEEIKARGGKIIADFGIGELDDIRNGSSLEDVFLSLTEDAPQGDGV